jgi:uncharacterized protein (TIGR03083 family)
MTTTSIVRPGPDRDQTIAGLVDQYRLFAELIAALSTSEWDHQTRCTGWQVRDVAGHVVGQAVDTVGGTIGSRTPDEQAAALRGRTPAALASQLHTAMDSMSRLVAVIDDAAWSAASPVPGLTLGQGVHALLHDAYLHGDDIRAALGLPVDGGAGMHASLDFVLGALLRDDAAANPPSSGCWASPSISSARKPASPCTIFCSPPPVEAIRRACCYPASSTSIANVVGGGTVTA